MRQKNPIPFTNIFDNTLSEIIKAIYKLFYIFNMFQFYFKKESHKKFGFIRQQII